MNVENLPSRPASPTPPSDASAQPEWLVSYEVRSGIDNHQQVLGRGEVTVVASDAEQATDLARAWVFDHDPYADERVDPAVVILDVEEQD